MPREMPEKDSKEDVAGDESTEEDKAETSGDADDSAGDDADAPKKRKRGAPAKGSKRGVAKEKEDKAETSGDADDSAGDDADAPKKRKRGPAKGSKTGTGAKKKVLKKTHPKTTDMIIEAIENMNEKKGSSYQAIKAYILQNFKTVRPDMIRSMMRRSLKSGLDQNVFGRPKGQTSTHGMSGRYVLGKSARKEEEEEVMPQKSKRAQAVAALSAKKKKKGGKKRGKAKKPVAKKAKGRK